MTVSDFDNKSRLLFKWSEGIAGLVKQTLGHGSHETSLMTHTDDTRLLLDYDYNIDHYTVDLCYLTAVYSLLLFYVYLWI